MMKSHTLSRLSVKTLLGEQEDKQNIKAEGLLSKAFFETVRTTWKVTDKSPATAEMSLIVFRTGKFLDYLSVARI